MIMRKNNWKMTAIVALLSISMLLPATSGSAAAAFAVTPKDVTTHKATATEPTVTPDSKATPPILETDVASASNGCTMLGIYGSYYSQAQEALDKLNEIRKEACIAGNVPDPRDPSRMLTSDDYKPLKWSRDLESIARIRAAEAGISYHFMASGHDRPNDKDTFSLSFHGVSSNCEDLAYCWEKSMIEGVILWKSEQTDWVNQNLANETGHYRSMINPKYNYVGLGDFYSEAAPYPNTVAGEFSTRTGLNETMQDVQTDVIQKVEISNKYIKENFLDGTDTINTEQTSSLTAKVRLERTRSNGNVSTREIWSVQPLTYSSSDRTIATVDNNGNVTGLTNGDVTITAKADNTIFATQTVHISCAHTRKETGYTPATCTKNGSRTYHCDTCNKDFEEIIPKTPHNYVYGEIDANGKSTGICSDCQNTIYIAPPTSFDIYWRNSTSATSSYYSSMPASNPIGSTIYAWAQNINGDSDYQELRIESSDPSVVSTPGIISDKTYVNPLNVLAAGITQITVYPTYNPALKKTYTLRIGESGSVDIAQAEITLSEKSYIYTGNPQKPKVTVTMHGTTLTENKDYTIRYENNTAVGTATVRVTGAGLFCGQTAIPYTIQSSAAKPHTHVTVIDEAVPATCTTPGLTEGSHCSECGLVFTPQQVVNALGHQYKDGECTVCGYQRYVNKDHLRFTPEESVDGTKFASVSVVPNDILTGDIRVPSTITINDTSYPVRVVTKKAFAGQTNVTSITLPQTITRIDLEAFADCSKLSKMYFQSDNAPTTASDAWKNVVSETNTLDFYCPKYGVGYNNLAKNASATTHYDDAIPNHVHTMIFHDTVAATCTEAGSASYYTCSECCKVFWDADGKQEIDISETYLRPLGHDWATNFTIDIPATKTSTGEMSLHCKRCNERSRITEIPELTDNNDSDDPDFDLPNQNNNNPGNGQSVNKNNTAAPKVGTVFTVKGLRYRIANRNVRTRTCTVTCLGYDKKYLKNKKKGSVTLSIPAKIAYGKYSCMVTAIGNKAFYGCKALKCVSTGSNVLSIGSKAFSGCKALKKVTILKKTKKIEASAFAECSSLRTITIKTTSLTKKSIGKKAFHGIAKKAKFKLPSSKKRLYKKWVKK